MRVFVLLAAILSGCSSVSVMDSQVQRRNAISEAKFEPTRAKFTELEGGASSLQFGIWAGTPGKTAANLEFRNKIFDGFKTQCGFTENSLKEVRVVKHEPPTWYEVWVFNNPTSKRPDKTSGLSVVMVFNPSTNITNTSFYGNCE